MNNAQPKSKFSTLDKRRAIAGIIKRSASRLNNDPKMKEDAERFGKCDVGVVIGNMYGERLGDFHGVYTNGEFVVIDKIKDVLLGKPSPNMDEYDAVVTITEDAFMNMCTGAMTPVYAQGIGGIRVDGDSAYKIIVVGIAVGDMIYNVLKKER